MVYSAVSGTWVVRVISVEIDDDDDDDDDSSNSSNNAI
jgi:hypothetical protein